MPVTINGTTGISGVDGTNATPAVRGTDTNTGFVFGTDIIQVIEGGSESARFDASGNLLVGVTSANANGGVLQLKSGITFPATQVTSTDVNTLDDYEEGTWTPIASSSSGSLTAYSSNGNYTKIGRFVFVTGNVALTTVGTASGFLNVAGLPFTTINSVQRPTSPYAREDSFTGIMYGGFVNQNATTFTLSTLTYTAITWTTNYNYAFVFSYQTA